MEFVVRAFRKQQWLVLIGFAALAIQYAAAFGHHHAHHAHDAHGVGAALHAALAHIDVHEHDDEHGHHDHDHSHDDHGHHEHAPAPSDDDEHDCQTCLTTGMFAWSVALDVDAHPLGAREAAPQIAAPDNALTAHSLGRANMPRGPPLAVC